MRKLLLINVFAFLLSTLAIGQTPLQKNGKIKVVGNQLTNECGAAIQLRGMSTHGPQWYENCTTESAVNAMANSWGADILRLAMYTKPNTNNGYLSDITKWDNWINNMVTRTENAGMYCIIDWHILEEGNPNTRLNEAKTFFGKMSNLYKNKSHVLYEICNEPNGWGADWSSIKQYAEQIIPIIRANDPDAIIIVGTPEWSGKPWDVISNKLTGDNAHNVMYTFHFYAGSHFTQNELRNTLKSIPVFCTEWGTSAASGNSGYNASNATEWLNLLDGEGGNTQLVSWCNWSFADKDETSAGLSPGSCGSQSWTNTSTSGTYVRSKMNTADNFPTCNSSTDSDNDGVLDINDACSSTPSGETVNAQGCSDSDGDGVFNDKDLCPGSALGSTVDADGCVLNTNTTNFTAAIDSFNSVAPVSVGAGEYGIYWWVGEGGETTYGLKRTTDGMELNLTGASPTYQVFGLSFGEEGKHINLEDLRNADVNFNLTNNSSKDIFLAIQLQDSLGNKAEIFPEDPFGITWANQWKKMGIEIPAGKTVDVTLDLSSDPAALGGLAAGAYNCEAPNGGAVTCPATSHELDPTKVSQMIFIVNGGAGVDDLDHAAVTGQLMFNHFSIGDVVSTSSNIINAAAIADEDGDGVADENDICEGSTPGVIVDAQGCEKTSGTDTDGDGVDDAQDLCANSPVGATVDGQGCAASQLDSDGDGVTNDKDQCNNTPLGSTIDVNGCVFVTTTSLFHAAIDDFDAVEAVTVGANGEYGIFWWAGEAPTPYSVTRSTDGMTVSMTNASPDYKPFGVSFSGEGLGNYIDLKEFSNANIQMNITNNTNTEVTLTVQLHDVNGNIAEIVVEAAAAITWNNQWKKIGVVLPQNSTANYTIDLSGDVSQLGGFQAIEWGCATAEACPSVDYTFDASRLSQVTFTVNGGAGVDNQLTAATGDLVFNYFAIGEIQNSAAGIIQVGSILDEDFDGVADEDDICPGTLVGETVDEFGCGVVGLSTELDNNVRLFPIPAQNELTVSQRVYGYNNVAIMDLRGEVLINESLSSKEEVVSLEGLTKGVYIVQLKGDNNSEQYKIVVQ